MVGFQNVSDWAHLLVLGYENPTIKISGTVQTHYTYNLINSKLHTNSVPVKSSDFLMFRACFKASTYVEAEIHYAHIKCRCLVSPSLNHPCKSLGLLLICGSYIRPFANRVLNDWESKFQPLLSVKFRVYNCFVLPDGYFGLQVEMSATSMMCMHGLFTHLPKPVSSGAAFLTEPASRSFSLENRFYKNFWFINAQ